MARRMYVTVLDGQTRAVKGVLGNVGKLGYKRKLNDIWEGSFTLPAGDPGNDLIAAHDLIRFKDGRRGTVIMRALEQPEDDGGEIRTTVPYTLEGAEGTLLDDLFFGYQEIGGTGMDTAACIRWVLARQSTPRWVLRRCDFTYKYSYVMQNNNLLKLLWSLTTCFVDRYRWVFDTSGSQWYIDLLTVPDSRECCLLYGRNLDKVRRAWSGKALVNRIYCAGYGEGTNLLTISGVNGGKPYVQDDASVARYGVKCGMLSDKTIESAATLKAAALAALRTTAWPAYTYTATMADIYEQTGLDYDRVDEGRVVWVYDRARGMDTEAQVVTVTREDIAADPYDTEVEISDPGADIADSVGDLAGRISVAELYSQGATQVYSERYADNADANNPAAWSVYVDEDARTVNSILLRITLEKFRAYSKGAASGGGSVQTSGTGGGSTQTSNSGGGAAVTSDGGGYSSGAKYTGGKLDTDTHGATDYTEGPNQTTFSGHRHVDAHVHTLQVVTPTHTHDVSVPAHSHTLTIPSHNHTITIPAHSHDIVYGIYQGPQASGYALKVDGVTVPASAIADGQADIAPYLEVDGQGRITRGAWHTIEVTPTGLTRVVMEMYVRLYIQSVGGTVL